MLLVRIACSDPDCLEEREVAVGALDDAEGHPCDCGHGFVVMAIATLSS